MYFAFFCFDKPGQSQIRIDNRPAHLTYLKSFGDKVFLAGPLQTDDGQGMVGSLLVLDLEDATAAQAFAAGDPYAKAGLFESVVIRRWKKVIPSD